MRTEHNSSGKPPSPRSVLFRLQRGEYFLGSGEGYSQQEMRLAENHLYLAKMKSGYDYFSQEMPIIEAALSRFKMHEQALYSRSDKRAHWMVSFGVAACAAEPHRREAAQQLARKWIVEHPVRRCYFERWLELLVSQESLETVLLATPDNQELRSVCPLAASISGDEHKAALWYFQRKIMTTAPDQGSDGVKP